MKVWSKELERKTKALIDGDGHLPCDGDRIHLKHKEGDFGYIMLSDLRGDEIVVRQKGCEQILSYVSSEEMINDGWVLD